MKHRRLIAIFSPVLIVMLVASLPQPIDASETFMFYVQQSSDDCTKYSTTSFSLNATELRVGTVSSVVYNDNGILFQNVTVEAGELWYAKLWFKASTTLITSETRRVYMEDNVNPSTFTDLTDFDARTRSTDYTSSTVSWTAATWYAIGVTDLVQAMINREDWVSGNNMAFFLTHISGAGSRRAYSYDYSEANAPYLEIKMKEAFYVTFYNNNENGHYNDIYNTAYDVGMPNGTSYPVTEGYYFGPIAAFNSSYVFNHFNINGVNYTTNPTVLYMEEDMGNQTIWAYSEETPEATPYTYARFYYTLNSTSKTVTVYNNSTTNQGYFSYYSIDWGDGNATFGTTFISKSWEYWSYGDYTINLTVTTSGLASTDYYAEYVYFAKPEEEAVTEGIFIGALLLGSLGFFGFLFFLAKKRD